MTASRLHDLVTYDDRHNEANGEDNRDGARRKLLRAIGVPKARPTIPTSLASASGVKRALAGPLLLSHGTPMLLAGDEFGRTQKGNNNAYCQDNEIPGSTGMR